MEVLGHMAFPYSLEIVPIFTWVPFYAALWSHQPNLYLALQCVYPNQSDFKRILMNKQICLLIFNILCSKFYTGWTYLLLIHGILIQLAAATAVKGTNRPIRGGNFCNTKNILQNLMSILWVLHSYARQTSVTVILWIFYYVCTILKNLLLA